MKRKHKSINVWRFSLGDSWHEDCVLAELKKFFLVHKFLSLLQPETMQLLHWLMNNRVQFVYFWCCVPPDFEVQMNNFFSFVLFSSVIHKRRGNKLISKAIEFKLDISSSIKFAFFFMLKAFKNLLENYQFCQKSGDGSKARGGGSYSLCYYDAVRTKIDMWFNRY